MTEHRNRIIFEQLIYKHESVALSFFFEPNDITYMSSTISQQADKMCERDFPNREAENTTITDQYISEILRG